MYITIGKGTILGIILGIIAAIIAGHIAFASTIVLAFSKDYAGKVIGVSVLVAGSLGMWGGWELGHWFAR